MMERFSTHYKTRFFPVIIDLFNQLEFEYKALTWCYIIPDGASACRRAKHCSLEVLNWSLWFEPDAGQIRNLWKAVLCGGFGIIDVLIVRK